MEIPVSELTLKAKVDTSELDETTAKTERLKSLLEECVSIIDDLGKREIQLTANIEKA